jgi:hypothetical protein
MIMAKITNLRKWKNGEVFNARDYVYERDLIVNTVNNHEDRIVLLEDFEAGLSLNYLSKTEAEEQTVVSVVDFLQGFKVSGALLEYVNTEENIGLEAQLTNKFKLRIGQQVLFFGKASGTIVKGDGVQFAGPQGDHFLIKRAVQSEINANPEYFIGVAAHDFANEEFGFVVEFGPLKSILKTGLVQGNILWFDSSGSTAGALTNVKPPRGFAQIRLAAVLNSQNSQLGQWIIRTSILEDTSTNRILYETLPTDAQIDDLFIDYI